MHQFVKVVCSSLSRMASSLAEKINQNFLQCGICLEPFRNPRALPCLHSFCEECLERWAKTNKEKNSKLLICPNCKTPTQIPAEGVQGFPAHFLVNSLQNTVNMEKTMEDYSNKPCSKCNKPDQKATVYCRECKHFLCQSCFDKHKTWEVMKHHKITTVDYLSSGKATVAESVIQDQYCKEHDDELKKFYCETCGKPVCRDCIVMKQCCRDHDYITLKEASVKQSGHLQEAIKECNEKRKQCQAAIEKAERVKNQLLRSTEDTKILVEKAQTEFLQQLGKGFSLQESKINKQQKKQADQLDKITENLQEAMSKFESASTGGKRLAETGSHYDIASGYASALRILQEANQVQLEDANDGLSVISTPVLSTCFQRKQWEQSGHIQVINNSYNVKEEFGPCGIAVTSDNNIAIAYVSHVDVFSRSGNREHRFTPSPTFGDDVAVTSSNCITYLGYDPKVCYIFNDTFEQIKGYPIDHSGEHAVLTVDKNECIIVGLHDGSISIHNADDWSIKSHFKLHSRPESIAVTCTTELVVTTEKGTLEIMDYFGKNTCILQPPPDVKTWQPSCICCSSKYMYEIFVVNKGNPRGIYMYRAGWEHARCITNEITAVRGIAISPDGQELFVTEYSDNLVKIFQRPQDDLCIVS